MHQQLGHVRYGCTPVAIAYGTDDIVPSGDTHVVVVVLSAYVVLHVLSNSHDQVHITYDNFDTSIHEYVYHHTSVHRIVTNARLK